jgi:hypothetical protein
MAQGVACAAQINGHPEKDMNSAEPASPGSLLRCERFFVFVCNVDFCWRGQNEDIVAADTALVGGDASVGHGRRTSAAIHLWASRYSWAALIMFFNCRKSPAAT